MIRQTVKRGTRTEGTALAVNPAEPPNLSYTIITSIVLDGLHLPPTDHFWNSLLVATIRKACETTPADKLPGLISCRYTIGKTKGAGFKYIPDLGLSVQAQSAANAWKATYSILQQIKVPLELEFRWDNHPSAAFPGARPSLRIERP
jgi:hypothetical protein